MNRRCFLLILFGVLVQFDCRAETGTHEELLADIASKAESLRGDKLDELIDSVFTSEDPEQLKVLVEQPRTRSLLIIRFHAIAPSTMADRLLVALIARPWPLDRGPDGSLQSRNLPSGGDFYYYADYMKRRLGHAIVEPTSDDQLLKVASSLDERKIIAREFERELVKAGLATPEERTIPDAAAPVASASPRKDPHLAPPAPEEAKEAKTESKHASWWIGGISGVLLVVAGFFAFRRKAGA